MIKLLFNLALSAPIVIIIAATGAQIDTKNIDSNVTAEFASSWNKFSSTVHAYVVDHEDEVIDASKTAIGIGTDSATNAMSTAGQFAVEHRDQIHVFAEKTGEKINDLLSD